MNDNKEPRYVLIDALRGLAALMVLFHHMLHNSIMEVTLRHTLPAIMLFFCAYGAFGVQIFFVISGFVIAHSLRNNSLTRQSIGNFILRRQIRLDPPYWCTIAFVLLVQFAEIRIFPSTTPPLPHGGEILLNCVYVQIFAGATPIVGVAWTLCMEVQFYLVFILLLTLGQKKLSQRTQTDIDKTQISKTTIWLLTSSALVSIIFNLGLHGNNANDSPWFITNWFYFAGGVLCCWAVNRRIHPASLYLILVAIAGSIVPAALLGVGFRGFPPLVSGLLTLLLLYRAGQTGRLTVWGSNPVLQYLGRISYSLYLVHLTTAMIVLKLGYKLTGQNHAASVVWFCLAGVASLALAHLLHITIEQPSMRFAQKLKWMPSQAVVNNLAVVHEAVATSAPKQMEVAAAPVRETGV